MTIQPMRKWKWLRSQCVMGLVLWNVAGGTMAEISIKMRLRRLLVYVCGFFIMYLTLKLVKDSSVKTSVTCKVPEETEKNLYNLANEVHNILTELKVNHFLCYGSLWGALRNGHLLPWEDDVEFCAIDDKVFYLDEAHLLRVFRRHALELQYDSSEGFYTVFNSSKKIGRVEVFIFELDSVTNMMRRIGWKRRVLPPNCENSILHCFPPRLVTQPLPFKEFGKLSLPIPREELEIQKYHYPDDWWKEIKPNNC